MIYRHFTKTILAAVLSLTLFLTGCGGSLLLESGSDAAEGVSGNSEAEESVSIEDTGNEDNEGTSSEEDALPEAGGQEDSSGSEAGPENSDPVPEESEEEKEIPVIAPESFTVREDMEITFDPSWTYGEFSVINSGTAKLYYSHAAAPKDITVCINAGHGTRGGSNVKTQCHPDGTPKVTGGTTAAGETRAVAVSTGMDFADGTPERAGNLALALIVKDKLLEDGYNVLMIRETDDVQLDNIARTLIANEYADCHIAIHYDSTSSDKGAYFMSVPNVSSYRAMEPVASHWEEHDRLGQSIIEGLRSAGAKVMGEGSIEMDLTQTSYSTVPSIDLEVGDKTSDRSEETLNTLADGIVAGVNIFFKQKPAAGGEPSPADSTESSPAEG